MTFVLRISRVKFWLKEYGVSEARAGKNTH